MTRLDNSMANAFDPENASIIDKRDRVLIERRRQLLGQAYRLFYEHPVHVVRGEGVWLFDPEGKPYLDVYNNVASVGHCHPRVVEAISRQAATLNTHTRYLNETVLDYAEALLETFPDQLNQVMFTCTGSEANDLAIRLAREHTKGVGIIVTRQAYHGVTSAIAELSPAFGIHVPLGAHVRAIPAPNTYLHPDEDIGERFARHVQEAIDDLIRHGFKPAALLVDTIFSSDGVFTEPAGFLAKAVETIRAAGGIFIADEVQAGFGRTGTHMWGFLRHGLVPDIVTMGKPMGNGHPVAGLVAQQQILDEFGTKIRYFNTFGGNPVSSAAGMAVLDVIRDEKLQQNACETGAYLKAGFDALATKHELIGDVRGAGFFIAVEMVKDRRSKSPATQETSLLVNGLRQKRILISATGPHGNVLKVRPQLPFSKENSDMLLSAVDEILRAV